MDRKNAVVIFAFVALGCSTGGGETEREKIVSCAKLMNQKADAVREKLEEGEELQDSEVKGCLALFEELAARDACLRENRSDPLEYYACVHERLGLKEKKGGGKGQDKRQRCVRMYDKVLSCSKQVKLLEEMGKVFGNKDKFATECLKSWKEAEEMVKCADKGDCRDFAACIFKMSPEDMKKMEEMQRMSDMPPDAPAADMPPDAPADPGNP